MSVILAEEKVSETDRSSELYQSVVPDALRQLISKDKGHANRGRPKESLSSICTMNHVPISHAHM